MRWPGSTSASGGSSCSQISPRNRGQRVWKTQPDGGFAALGISPSSRMRVPLLALERRHRGEERLRVGMVRAGEDGLRVADLHEPAEVEHRDAVGDVAHDAEVVGDEEVASRPARACSSTRRLRIAAWTETSSAEVGSSQTTIRGSPAKARAIATRCFRPPESCAGLRAEERSVEADGLGELARARAPLRSPRRPSELRRARGR